MSKRNNQNTETVFSKGEVITNNYFTGTAWLEMLVTDAKTFAVKSGMLLLNRARETIGILIRAGKFYW